MTLPIGQPNGERAFTLVELMVVMTLLVVVISISVPSLSSFFHGRVLDSEARRLLALTHHGQSRAVSEGVPMILWVDAAQHAYGLEEESGFTDRDARAVEFVLDKDLQIQAVSSTTPASTRSPMDTSANSGSVNPHRNLPKVRFLPDATVDESSVSALRLVDRDGGTLWVSLSRSNRLNYEIHSQPN